MFPTRRRNRWFLARMVGYVGIIVAIVFFREDLGLNTLRPETHHEAGAVLSIRGSDLAPELISEVTFFYRRGRPRLEVRLDGGGTARALEAVLNAQSDVAFLARPPSRYEQGLFEAVSGDSIAWFPVAVGAILVLRGDPTSTTSVSMGDLQALAGGEMLENVERLYVPDPNRGLWDAFCGRLGVEPTATANAEGGVVFLADAAAVANAVESDSRSLGVVSSLELPATMRGRVQQVPIAAGQSQTQASHEAVASGEYPLFHHLFLACREDVSVEGSMFVTYLTSSRGQRSVERAGFLPAKQVLREVHLTRRPVGDS